MNIPQELLQKYHMNTLEGYLNDFGEEEGEYMYYNTFLCQTDHVPLKIVESFVENMASASPLETIGVIVSFFKDIRLTYSEVLRYRKLAREELSRIEAEQAAGQ